MNLRFKTLGVIFLALLLTGAYGTYAIFTKKFTDYAEVTMVASKIGLQLPARADVKVRGVLVGEVLDYRATADGAELVLGIYPEEIDTIPAAVTGSIVPKTLFGEKYVALDVPGSTTGGSALQAGDVIERSQVSTEVEQVISDIYPLLRTVRPADLNRTLSALATALEGRGEKIGDNLERLDSYLKRVNPLLPDLVEDLRLTSRVSDIYSDVMPQIARILRDTVRTGNTLRGREERLKALFNDVSAFSDTARSFLRDNEENIIRLGELGVSQTRLLAKYAPEYPCLVRGLVGAGRRTAESYRNYTLHINLELVPQSRGYTAADRPRYGAKNGPNCLSLPNPPYSQENLAPAPPNLDDGVDEPTGKGTMRAPAAYRSGPVNGLDGDWAGTASEDAVLRGLLASPLGTTADDVEDLGPMLLAPMARGAEVSLR